MVGAVELTMKRADIGSSAVPLLTPSSSSSSVGSGFINMCTRYGVDSRLLYNDIEQLSHKRFARARRLVWYSRLLSVAVIAAAGTACTSLYYRQAQLHRVWRLRNPHRVQQLERLTVCGAAFSVLGVLFLVSPMGWIRRHDRELEWTRRLDTIAVAALVQELHFRTLASWARHSTAAVQPPPPPSASQALGDDNLDPEVLWEGDTIVLDPMPFESARAESVTALPASSKEPVGTPQNAVRSVVDMRAIAATTKSADEHSSNDGSGGGSNLTGNDFAQAKQHLVSQLLRTSEAGNGGEAATTASEEPSPPSTGAHRVWTRTGDPEVLQQILAECIERSALLSKEKDAVLRGLL